MKVEAKVLNFKVHDGKTKGLKCDLTILSLEEKGGKMKLFLLISGVLPPALEVLALTLLPGWLNTLVIVFYSPFSEL